jgi:enamine deaminase RidA (YjgF/YER057c/UK114 family)
MSTADERFIEQAQQLGHSFDGPIKIGGHYVPIVQDGSHLYISGQTPRVGDTIVVTGRAGTDISLSEAQYAAKICVMRALALLRQQLGSLANIKKILRITVFVQCTDDFTQQSEVADGASDLLFDILGDVGAHSRTSVGVYQLPKNATVEIDMIASA